MHLRHKWPNCCRDANRCERAGGDVQEVAARRLARSDNGGHASTPSRRCRSIWACDRASMTRCALPGAAMPPGGGEWIRCALTVQSMKAACDRVLLGIVAKSVQVVHCGIGIEPRTFFGTFWSRV